MDRLFIAVMATGVGMLIVSCVAAFALRPGPATAAAFARLMSQLKPFIGCPEPRLLVERAHRLGRLLSAFLRYLAVPSCIVFGHGARKYLKGRPPERGGIFWKAPLAFQQFGADPGRGVETQREALAGYIIPRRQYSSRRSATGDAGR